MSSSQLDLFAAAALQGLLIDREWDDAEQLAREAFRIARAMMTERARQDELPDSDALEVGVLEQPIDSLELSLRIVTKLKALGIARVRDLTLTTASQIKNTGLGDESLAEIKGALHRHGLTLST